MRVSVPSAVRGLFAPILFAGALAAQPKTGALAGVVIDKSSRAPVASAEVINQADSRSVRTDSVGRFLLGSLNPGVVRLIVRAIGFPATTFDVHLAEGERLEPVIRLDSTAAGKSAAQALPEVAVSAPSTRGPRYADFERRQKTGRGQYRTREELERDGHTRLFEVLRTMRGVSMDCAGPGCLIRMARAPMRCLPEYVVDERVDNQFGPTTPVRDIEALEVYTGPSDVPGEFAGRNAGCGVIVIWTKSGPPRRKT